MIWKNNIIIDVFITHVRIYVMGATSMQLTSGNPANKDPHLMVKAC